MAGLARRLPLVGAMVDREYLVIEGGVRPAFRGVALPALLPERSLVLVFAGMAAVAVLWRISERLPTGDVGVALLARHALVPSGELERQLAVVEVGSASPAAVVADQAVFSKGRCVLAHEARIDSRMAAHAG